MNKVLPPDPLESLAHLETWVLKCGECSEDVQTLIESIRTSLRVWLDEPENPLEDAEHAIMKAHFVLRFRPPPDQNLEALVHELLQLAEGIHRAQKLWGSTLG